MFLNLNHYNLMFINQQDSKDLNVIKFYQSFPKVKDLI